MTLRHPIRFFVVALGVVGILYPLLLGGVGQFLFPFQTNGSILFDRGKPVGSYHLGQEFVSEKYFWGRPKAKTPNTPHLPFDQLVEENPALHGKQGGSLEMQLPTLSGVDAFITLEAAKTQVERVSKARNLPKDKVTHLLDTCKTRQTFGHDLIHVLTLNLALDHGQEKCGGGAS